MTKAFKLPTNQQRVAVIGRTGSGKTQFGAWLLSEAPFDKQPYIIFDYKGDDLLGGTDKVREIGLSEKLPKAPGLYIVRPRPETDDEAVDAFLWRVWEQERIGLYFDEMYVLPKNGKGQSLLSILTQGRSKRIPAICLTQRPAFTSRFVFSEADFYAVFNINDIRDKQIINGFTPPEFDLKQKMPPYHSMWYDVKQDATFRMLPVPSADDILNRIEDRSPAKGKRL